MPQNTKSTNNKINSNPSNISSISIQTNNSNLINQDGINSIHYMNNVTIPSTNTSNISYKANQNEGLNKNYPNNNPNLNSYNNNLGNPHNLIQNVSRIEYSRYISNNNNNQNPMFEPSDCYEANKNGENKHDDYDVEI